MSSKIVVIYTTDTKPVRYVSSTGPRDQVVDRNLLAELTTNPEEAHDFKTEEEAKDIVPKLHNPFERTYLVKSIPVKTKRSSLFIRGDIN